MKRLEKPLIWRVLKVVTKEADKQTCKSRGCRYLTIDKSDPEKWQCGITHGALVDIPVDRIACLGDMGANPELSTR